MNKHVVFIIICFSISLTACTKIVDKNEYSFSISQDRVEEAISERHLTWHIQETVVITEYNVSHILKVDDTKAVVTLGTLGLESGQNRLSCNTYFPPDYTNEQMQFFNNQVLPHLIDMVGEFYDNKKAVEGYFSKVMNYATNVDSKMIKYISRPDRSGDTHFDMHLYPFDTDVGSYQMSTMYVMNTKAYELQTKAYVNSFKKKYGSPLSGTISEIKRIMMDDISKKEEPVFIVVSGKLKNLKIPEDFSQYFTTDPAKLLRAKLVDSTGTLEVAVRSNSYTYEELGTIRDHYILYYKSQESKYIIMQSPLME